MNTTTGILDRKCCAIGSVYGESLISKLIVFIQGDSDKSHSYFYENDEDIIETNLFRGARKRPAIVYKNKKTSIYRPKFLTTKTKQNMVILANYILGESYGITKLPLLALDSLTNSFFFSKHFGITNFKVCSHVIGWLYQKTPIVECPRNILYKIYKGEWNHSNELNYKFGALWKYTNPDMLEDWMRDNPEQWEKVQ